MKKLLIANRGEIAIRVARAAADLGISSVAVYADPDADALHVRACDEAYALGGSRPADSYLSIERVLDAARRSGADAVHPGYGFLSESAAFARAVTEAGLTWVGPSPEAIDQLGDKVQARQLAERVGAPLVPGTSDPVPDGEAAVAFAEEYGLPIAIKAAFGGGGRGMRVAWRLDEVAEQFDAAVREATVAFGRGECFVERFLDRPRHIEVQVLADAAGTVWTLGTRDCSLQRRNQKLVEEAPAPGLSDSQREELAAAARALCLKAGYVGAGTVEFLLGTDGTLSFLEVNTRLQVEHTVTEEIYGVDLVAWQLRIAAGQTLPGSAPEPRGHALEFRINAEDPARGFLPAPGTVRRFVAPSGPGVRLDTGVAEGSTVPPVFDSLLAKLVVTGSDRAEAIRRARRALAEFLIEGLPTVLPFHRAVLEDPDFAGDHPEGHRVHTRWIETVFDAELAVAPFLPAEPEPGMLRAEIELDGRRVSVGLPGALLAALGGLGGSGAAAQPEKSTPAASDVPGDSGAVPAPITGTVQAWLVTEGETVEAGQTLGTMEAMKMETPIVAARAGAITGLEAPGAFLTAGTPLATIG